MNVYPRQYGHVHKEKNVEESFFAKILVNIVKWLILQHCNNTCHPCKVCVMMMWQLGKQMGQHCENV